MHVRGSTTWTGSWWFTMKWINRNWTGYAGVCFWHHAAPGTMDITVAVRDADDEIWYGYVPYAALRPDWTRVCVPFASLIRDNYDHLGNGILDLSFVKEFRYRHAPQSVEYSEYWVDDLEVVTQLP